MRCCPRIAPVALCVMLLVVPAGCSANDDAPADDTAASRSATRGPVTLTVSVDRETIRVGDQVVLTIDVTAEPGVDVEMPRLEGTVGTLRIRASRRPPDVPAGARRRWTHEYELATFEPGEAEIPSLAVTFTDRRAADAAGEDGESGEIIEIIEGELASEPLALVVASVLTDDVDPAETPPIRGTVELPFGLTRWWPWLTAGGVALLAAVVALAWWMVRRRPTVEPAPVVIPAHVWAFGELDRLEADDLLERRRVEAYYARLSDVVRQYIERRFRLRAPERTTDEFLREARLHPALRDTHKELLARFLRSADMVKFARHEPAIVECTTAMTAARSFVDETADRRTGPRQEVAA